MSVTSVQQLCDALACGHHTTFYKNGANAISVAGSLVLESFWKSSGRPVAAPGTGAAYTSGGPYTFDKSSVGAIDYTNATTQNYLAKISLYNASSIGGVLILADRLWACSGLGGSATAAQFITSPGSLPARITDNGLNCELITENSTVSGTASGSITATYLDSTGATKTATFNNVATNQGIGAAMFFPLANNLGVKQLVSVQHSATWTSGVYGMVIIKRLAEFPLPRNFDDIAAAKLSWASVLQKIPNDACLMLLFLSASSNNTCQVVGSIDIVDL